MPGQKECLLATFVILEYYILSIVRHFWINCRHLKKYFDTADEDEILDDLANDPAMAETEIDEEFPDGFMGDLIAIAEKNEEAFPTMTR